MFPHFLGFERAKGPARRRGAAAGSPREPSRGHTQWRLFWLAPTLTFLGSSYGCVANELGDRHAAAVESYLKTPGLPDDAASADPTRALGPPDGRTLSLGRGAYVVIRFFRPIPDGPGPDLRVYEVGPDGARARVAVSSDGARFFELPLLAEGPTTEIDLFGAATEPVAFVRIRGVDDAGLEAGFDLDSVEALH